MNKTSTIVDCRNIQKRKDMTEQEAIKYLKQLYPHGGCCWLDEQRIDAISIAINAIEKVSKLGHSEMTKISDQEISMEVDHLFKENGWSCLEEVDVDLVARHFVNWQNEQIRMRAYCWLKNQPKFCVTDDFIKEFCDYITDVETKKGGDNVQKR